VAEQYPHLIIQQAERDLEAELFPAMHKHLEPCGYAAMCRVIGDIDYVWVYSVGATVATYRTHDKARVVDMYSRSTGADGELERFREELARLGIGGGK
jgi:hypothetical protein